MFLLINKISKYYPYDNNLIFLMWRLVPRERHINKESISDWMFEVVEIYFEHNNLSISDLYRNVFKTLSAEQ